MTRGFATAAAIVVWLCAGAAWALETLKIEVTHQDGRYTAVAVFLINAPRPSVYAVLTNYEALERISPQIKESELLGVGDDGRPLVRVITHSCVMFFCRTVEMVQVVTEMPPGRIDTRVLPERSDLKYGATTWLLVGRDKGTLLTWRTTFIPDFWVPPLIGPAIIEITLTAQLADGAAGIERLARARTR